MKSPNFAPVAAPIDQITPLYDYLLVRRLRDHEQAGLIVESEMVKAPNGRWVKKPDHGPRRGVVVAAGRGDKVLFDDRCGDPDCDCHGDLDATWTERVPMDVKIGDTILYPRFEANHVIIGDEQLTFVHEADVMAVFEA